MSEILSDKKHEVKILQVNIRGVKSNFNELCNYIIRENVDIIVLQET